MKGPSSAVSCAGSPPTVRPLYRDNGLDRHALRNAADDMPRLRWQAESPNARWHGDVCHGPAITVAGVSRSLRIHGLLDDCSRYVPALEAHYTERESAMLDVFAGAIRRERLRDEHQEAAHTSPPPR